MFSPVSPGDVKGDRKWFCYDLLCVHNVWDKVSGDCFYISKVFRVLILKLDRITQTELLVCVTLTNVGNRFSTLY